MLKIPALEVTLKTVQRDLLSELRWFGVLVSLARSTTLVLFFKASSDTVVDLAKDPCRLYSQIFLATPLLSETAVVELRGSSCIGGCEGRVFISDFRGIRQI